MSNADNDAPSSGAPSLGAPQGVTSSAADESELSAQERLEREVGVLPWSELVRHFARGVVVTVRADVDLVQAALRFSEDDVTLVNDWLESGRIARASDDDARRWVATEPEFRCVVAAPWVLVQERV